jgi:hypothetical protein
MAWMLGLPAACYRRSQRPCCRGTWLRRVQRTSPSRAVVGRLLREASTLIYNGEHGAQERTFDIFMHKFRSPEEELLRGASKMIVEASDDGHSRGQVCGCDKIRDLIFFDEWFFGGASPCHLRGHLSY